MRVTYIFQGKDPASDTGECLIFIVGYDNEVARTSARYTVQKLLRGCNRHDLIPSVRLAKVIPIVEGNGPQILYSNIQRTDSVSP
jgi:hypothetical protein